MIHTGFKDPLATKIPKDKKSPWSYTAPPYDQRSGCFVEAGDDFGRGHRQPVGHSGNPRERVDTLPFGRVRGRRVDYVNTNGSYQIDITDDGE